MNGQVSTLVNKNEKRGTAARLNVSGATFFHRKDGTQYEVGQKVNIDGDKTKSFGRLYISFT